jgi:RimJ/RimL family protein N-acetyltransferase
MPTAHVSTVRLRSGEAVLVRPLERPDATALARAVEQMSELSRYRRFHTGMSRLSEDMLTTLTDIDHHDHEAVIALRPDSNQDPAELLGLARFVRIPGQPDTAELAVGVADSWQRRGLATVLLCQLAERAATVGINHFTATVLTDNTPTIALLKQLGDAQFSCEGPVLSARMHPTNWAHDAHVVDTGGRPLLPVPAEPDVYLLPRLLRALLGLSSDLTRTMIFPVSVVLRRRREHADRTSPGSH